MRNSVVTGGLVLAAALSPAFAQVTGKIGWYNGGRQSAIPGMANWYQSANSYKRIFDDFVVPPGGWTIQSVFSENSLSGSCPARAYWEIRAGLNTGNGGSIVASGLGTASCTAADLSGLLMTRVQVGSLHVVLPEGRYWLSVAPMVQQGDSWIGATIGAGAVGDPPGNDGLAYFDNPGGYTSGPVTSTGSGGTARDFSLGLVVAPSPMTAARWQDDVQFLAHELPARHFRPYGSISEQDFQGNAAALVARIPNITAADIRTGIQAMVASINDSHTDVGFESPSPFHYLPLSFYWFEDALYVTAATDQYRDLLGARLTGVGGVSAEEAYQRLTKLIPHENDSWVKQSLPGKMANADFLFGTGIANSVDSVHIEARNAKGETVSAEVRTYTSGQYVYMSDLYQGPLPVYRLNAGRYYWSTLLDDGATLYFQYNQCEEDPKLAWSDFLPQLQSQMANQSVQRLVIDLRNNTGGTTAAFNPVINQIIAGRFNAPGKLFVIIGRRTFSATMLHSLRFHNETMATLVGEPTGGKPRFYFRYGDFALPNSGIRVNYSVGQNDDPDPDPSLMPDVPAELKLADYINGVDPAMEAIRARYLP